MGCFAVWVVGEDQYRCHRCGTYWGYNSIPPDCLTNQEIQDAVNKCNLAKLKEVLGDD